MPRWKWPKLGFSTVVGLVLVVGSLLTEGAKVYTAADDTQLSQLDIALFDALIFFLGGVGLFLLSEAVTARRTAADRAPHGRSAFLRAVELFQALRRFQNGIDRQLESLERMSDKSGKVSLNVVGLAFDSIRTQVGEQVLTSSHAMEDWRIEFPETIAELEAQAVVEQAVKQTGE